MPQYIDCYFLINSRSSDLIEVFLNKYLPAYKQSADEYPVPLFGDSPSEIFDNTHNLLVYLENDVDCEYSIYWHNTQTDSVIQHAMVFHTDDGKMIFGVSVIGSEHMAEEIIRLFNEIKECLDSDIGCITSEEPPPSNSIDFMQFARERYIPV